MVPPSVGTCLPREQRAGRRLESYGEESGRTAMFFRLSDPKTRARILISSMLLFFLISERQSGFFRYYYFFLINLFIYLFLAVLGLRFVRGLSPVAASGGHSSSQCVGLSLSWPLLLQSTGSWRTGSVVVAYGPSCSTACGIFLDQGSNPGPGLESVSPALAGGFPTTAPPGKP